MNRTALSLALCLSLLASGGAVALAQEPASPPAGTLPTPTNPAPSPATQAAAQEAPAPTTSPTPQSEPPTPAPAAPALPFDDPDGAALASIEAFKTGARPPVVERPGMTLVPFGYAAATLRCAPLRVCAVELARGEQILNVATGDSERWAVQPAATGAAGATPVLFVKPTACNVTTNLAVTTDRHVYQLLLDSPPCDEAADHGYNPRLPYTPLVRFYHPNEFVATWARANARSAQAAASSAPLSSLDLDSLNFAYTWHPEHRFPWTPAQVFDDGTHCYVHLPSRPKDLEAPVLAVVEDDGKQTLINYAVRGDYYVTDRLFRRAVFLLGDRRLLIERRAAR